MMFYMIRHIKSGQFMPEMKHGKGYSHWNPETGSYSNNSLDSPRLFGTIKRAKRCAIMWVTLPNGKTSSHQSYFGEYIDDIHTKPDGRKLEDLEVLEVELFVGKRV